MRLIGELIEILSGYAFKSSLFNDKGDGLPLVRIRDVGKKKSNTFYPGAYDDKYILKDGDYLIGMDGDFRLSEWQGGVALLNQRVCKISPKKDLIEPRYLYYILPKELKRIEDSTSFATVKHLSVKKINSIKIPLPPLAEQQKIAAILDAADQLRQKDQQLIDHYTTLSQSLFLDMFGDPVTNPMGWEKKTLLELTNKITDGTHHTPLYTESGVPFLRVTDITKSNESKKFISEEEHYELIKRCHPEKGDILYTKNGTIGVGKIIDWDYDFSIFVSLCLLKPKHEIINVKYLNHFLNTPFAIRQAMRHSKVATIKNLHLVEIKKMKVPYPSLEQQNKFVYKLEKIEQQKQLAQASLKKSETLFNSLLQRAFKGELTHSGYEAPAS